MENQKSIADKVNVGTIEFEKRTRTSKIDKAIVSFSPSVGTLFFNPKMVKLLNIAEWKQVLVGFDKTSNIIVLKECGVEEYGAILVRNYKNTNTEKTKNPQASMVRDKKCRVISIRHLIQRMPLPKKVATYKAERSGMMVFLENLNDTSQ